MSPTTRWLSILLLAPAILLLLFGPSRRAAAPPDRTIIRYWEKWSGVEALAMRRIVDRYNDTAGAEAGVWVDYCSISNVDQRLMIATAGGDPPDVAGLYDMVVPQFSDQGALMELSDLAREYGISKDVFKPTWWEIGEYQGGLFALPSAPFTVALYYNRAAFREAGLDPDRPPRTIAELEQYSEKLTLRNANGRLTRVGFTVSPAILGWWHWIWPFFFDARPWDGTRYHVDTPETAAALNWIAASREKLSIRDCIAFESTAGVIEGPQNPFLSGQIAMVFQGPWMSNWIARYKPDLDYGVAAFPSAVADHDNAFASADVFVIPTGSHHPREAMDFLQYVLRKEVMEELCKAHCKVSPFREPGADFYTSHPNPHARLMDSLANAKRVFGYPKAPMFRELSDALRNMLDDMLRGAMTPEQAMAATQIKLDRIAETYERMSAKRSGKAVAAGAAP